MMRSPITGSKGPKQAYSWEDWSTIREVLSRYPVPFEDLDVPTHPIDWEGESVRGADWCDDAVYADILEAQYAEVGRRMDLMRCDGGDPAGWDVHHWQDINPVHTEALVQLTCGGPQIIYHGGLLHVRLRFFDVRARRPGLPPHTAALVSALDADSTTLHLVNLSPLHRQDLVLQAGAFGEHSFTEVVEEGVPGAQPRAVEGKWLRLDLAPGCAATLRLGMRRYCRSPSYDQPW